ncbi:MAG: 2Fe-2S iron-sulfur cluster-binding protein [Acidimicrobiales bacterium]
MTPARRVAGRHVTTLQGLDAEVRDRWAGAFAQTGASQCGFCTPGILMRLAALETRKDLDDAAVGTALAAHLCRCTGWVPIFDAARMVGAGAPGAAVAAGRDLEAAARRATIEGGAPQRVGVDVVLGGGGFADDTAPPDALVAVPDGTGGWIVAETLHEARLRAGKVQGRRTTVGLRHPVGLPDGDFVLRLQTTFVEPAYLEPDASWCAPGGEPASALANGGAFGAKRDSPVADAARRLADEHGRPVRVVLAREDVVRGGPKRPPIAAGVRADGTGVIRVGRTPGSAPLGAWRQAVVSAGGAFEVVEVEIPGPPVSPDVRAAGWAEAAVLQAAATVVGSESGAPVTVRSPEGALATVAIGADGAVAVTVEAGEVLDEVVLRSYVTGAVHQGLGWVRTEGIAVDEDGEVLDLTIRSFGIIPAREMPPVTVSVVEDSSRPPVRVGDAVFAATAAAAWVASGLAPAWPLQRGGG